MPQHLWESGTIYPPRLPALVTCHRATPKATNPQHHFHTKGGENDNGSAIAMPSESWADGLIEVKISSNQRGKNLTGLLNLT